MERSTPSTRHRGVFPPENEETGDLPAQQIGDLGGGSLELVGSDRRDGADHAGFLLRTVTHDHRFLDGEVAFGNSKVGGLVLAAQFCESIFITEERDAERGVFSFILNGITALGVRYGTIGRILDPNLSAGNRFVGSSIRNDTFDGLG